MPESFASDLPAPARLCREIAALLVEHSEQVADPLLLANFLSLYSYHLEACTGDPVDFDDFVFDSAALAEAAQVASVDHGQSTLPPEPLERHSIGSS